MGVILAKNCCGVGGNGGNSGSDSGSSSSIELSHSVVLTAQDITNKYIELPEDCDARQAVTVTWQNMPRSQGTSWEVIIKDPPELDRVAWDGLALESLMRKGDRLDITYYKKG